jgi:predicted unusual protein kinase regulating ubiquinone biosynthesis (AarF/ABC1/UbiB family)
VFQLDFRSSIDHDWAVSSKPNASVSTASIDAAFALAPRTQVGGLNGYRRAASFVWIFTRFAIGFWVDARYTGERRASRQRRRASWLKERFIELGSTFVKIGQMLSTRPDLVPLPYVQEMASLQDRVPPFDSDVAYQIIETELGRPISDVFAVFNPYPLAAASIGQVYKARLADGTDVVVKVQRPGLMAVVALDLAIMRRVARFIEGLPWSGRHMPYGAIIDEFAASFLEQCDYTAEGRHAERFAQAFASFSGVRTPRVHWPLTTPRVMTMDFVDGFKVTDLVALEGAGISFQDVVRVGVRATIKQLLEDGFFHADVHPGNLFVERDSTLVYIDFGMVGELSDWMQEKIVDIFLHSVHRNYAALVDDFIALEFLSPRVDRQRLIPVAKRIFEAQYGETGQRMSMREIFTAVSEVLYEYPFRIPEKIAFILRTIITLEGIIHQLWPEFQFLEVAAPYAAKILLTDAKARIRDKLVDELFDGERFKPERLQRLFGAATREPSFRFGEVAQAVLQYLGSPDAKRIREGLLVCLDGGDGVAMDAEVVARYVALAEADPDWTLDDLFLPFLRFSAHAEGVDYTSRLLARLGRRSPGAAPSAVWALLEGRELSDAGLADVARLLGVALGHPGLRWQPALEWFVDFLETPAGAEWFFKVGDRLLARSALLSGHFATVLSLAATHPHLNLSPLIETVFTLATRPEAQSWQRLLVIWLQADQTNANGRVEVVWRTLRHLVVEKQLNVFDLAFPAVGFIFSDSGQPLRQELLSKVRTNVDKVDLGALAQGLWRAAGSAWQRLRGEDTPSDRRHE